MFTSNSTTCDTESSHWSPSTSAQPGCTDPIEITLKQWERHLEVLPPLAWVIEPGTESFRAPDPVCGDIHLALVRIGRKFYSMHQPLDVPHGQLVAQIVLHLIGQPQPKPRRRGRLAGR